MRVSHCLAFNESASFLQGARLMVSSSTDRALLGLPPEDETDPAPMAVGDRGKSLVGLLFSSPSLALVDQVIVSGTRFATTLIIGRLCGPEGLGIYMIAFAVMLTSGISQESLLAKPYQVFVNRLSGRQKQLYSGSVLVQHGAFVIAVLLLAALAALLFFVSDFGRVDHRRAVLALTIAVPGMLVWEFARRFVLAQLKMRAAVAIDASLAAMQIGGLLTLGYWHVVTVPIALSVIGLASLVVGVSALLLLRKEFLIRSRRIGPDIWQNWVFGKWMFTAQLVGLLQAYTVPILLAWSVGPTATGIVMACQTIVLLSNPFLLGIANWFGPATARGYAEGGVAAVTAMTVRVSAILAIVMTLFWILLAIWGEFLLVLAFGPEYSGYGIIVGITGLSALGFGISIGATCGLAAINRPQLVLWGTIAGAVVSLVSFFPLTTLWGLSGAAWSLGIGSSTTALVQSLGYLFSANRMK